MLLLTSASNRPDSATAEHIISDRDVKMKQMDVTLDLVPLYFPISCIVQKQYGLKKKNLKKTAKRPLFPMAWSVLYTEFLLSITQHWHIKGAWARKGEREMYIG